MMIINDGFTSSENLDIHLTLDDSPTDLDISLKSCEIAQLVIVIGEPVIDSTIVIGEPIINSTIVIGEPIIDSPNIIPHRKVALQLNDQISDIQTKIKK